MVCTLLKDGVWVTRTRAYGVYVIEGLRFGKTDISHGVYVTEGWCFGNTD